MSVHAKRDDSAPMNRTTIGLLVALLVLIIIGASVIGTLLVIRRRRRSDERKMDLPLYNEKAMSMSSSPASSPRRSTKESIIVYQEKKNLLQHSDSPPNSPLPEIRITFPEEYDASGKRTSGRVVVVRVGDTSVGLEPLDEKLPLYEQEEGGRFDSVDLERVGGLTEKQIHDKTWS